MNPVITAVNKITSTDTEKIFPRSGRNLKPMRFIHDLDKLAIAAIGITLEDAMIPFPVGNSDISLYIGIDDSIEDIKNDYFRSIIAEGILGASPLLFPLTTPNALAAQASILFDIRGESITFSLNHSFSKVLEYVAVSLAGGYTKMAIAGNITKDKSLSGPQSSIYRAEFFFIETITNAKNRGARIHYYNLGDAAL